LDEATVVAPEALLGPYPSSKRRGELAVAAAADQGLAVCSVLPSGLIGPEDWRMTPPTRLLADLLAEKAPAYLDCLINLVDVRDCADAAVAALEHGAPGARYLTTGEDRRFGAFLETFGAASGVATPRRRVPYVVARAVASVEEAIGAVTGRSPKAPVTGVRLAGRQVRFDATRAREALGFAPRPLADSLADAAAWLRDTGRV
jgi:dihydroflavonol-4-reductase